MTPHRGLAKGRTSLREIALAMRGHVDTHQVVLDLDTSSPIRTLARYRDLVMAVLHASAATQETNWLEWKSQGDASEKRWRAELSKQVLGFANRDPDVAAKSCGGCAFVLLGVAPGELAGTVVHDAAKVESWLAPYVGQAPDGPDWHPAYVDVDGVDVLVLTVEPPKWGDPIWACHKDFLVDPRSAGAAPTVALREGAIYVRHQASTSEPTVSDLAMLQRRLLGGSRRIAGLSLVVAEGCQAAALDYSPEAVEAWAERERAALAPPPPAPDPSSHSSWDPEHAAARMVADLQRQLAQFAMTEPDRRTVGDYEKEVEDYLTEATEALVGVMVSKAYKRGLGRITFVVRNDTDHPVHGLQVEVSVPVKGVLGVDESEIPASRMPPRPIMLGKGGRSVLDPFRGMRYELPLARTYESLSHLSASVGRRVQIDNSNSVTLTFDPLELYPEEAIELEEVWLFANPALAGEPLPATWTSRSRDASGVLRGDLEVVVDPIVHSIDKLLAASEEDPFG